jgi:ABC-2 type transport system permease protein
MQISHAPHGLRFATELWLLLCLRWRLLRNGSLTHLQQHPWRWLVLGVVAGLFVVGDYVFFWWLMRHIFTIPGGFGPLLMTQLLNMVFLTFFSMLLFSNIIASLATIYLSSDLLILMSSPLRLSNVFITKFYQTLLNSSWMVALFGLPVFIAFGRVHQASFSYYGWLLPIFVPFLIIPAGVGMLFTMVLMRYFPARQTHKALTILSVCCMAILVTFIRFLRPERLVREASDEVILQFLDALKIPDFPFLPSTWATKALLAGVGGLPGGVLSHALLLWGGASAIFVLAVWVASRVYYTGWAGGGPAARHATPRRAWKFERCLTPLLRLCMPATRGLILKDLKLFFRDPAQWSQLFLLGALAVVYLYNIQNLPANTLFLKNLIAVLNIGLAGFVLSAVAARFVFTSTSLEGRSFWVVLSSPIAFRRFLQVKFLLYILPLLVLAETLVVVSNLLLKADVYITLFSVIVIMLMTCSLTGLGVGLGAMYPRFQYENIAETAASVGGMIYMLLSLCFVGLTMVLAARPLYVHLRQKFLPGAVGGIEVYLCYGAIGVLCLVTTWLPMVLGRRALERLEF